MNRREEDKWQKWDKRIRDLVIFMISVGALVNELLLEAEPDPATLVFLASILGLPLVLRADENRRQKP